MLVMTWSAIVGTMAALCTTLAFWPQLRKVRRQGGADRRPVRRRLRIAIDMDEVMADALAEHVRRYNAAFGAQLTIADLHGRSLEDHVPAAHREATESLLDASFFRDLAVMADCQDVIRDLAERHDVFVVTAAMDVPVSFDAKYQWLQEHFPFIPPSRFVFCGDKGLIDADYLIDDRSRHFDRFKGRPLLYSAPHNAAETRYPRVGSWAEIRALFANVDGAGAAGHGAAGSSRWLQPRERSL
jgi:5'(3')-deoxyribonucleotidase